MRAIKNLNQLLANLRPKASEHEYVFCALENTYSISSDMSPFAIIHEREGATLILKRDIAEAKGLTFDGFFKRITLDVHSSLNAVGLTASVSTALAEHNISANVIAAYYHDHIFVPSLDTEQALEILKNLSSRIDKGKE